MARHRSTTALHGFTIVTLALALAASPGCATLITPRMQDVQVTSTPASADVWVDGELVGPSPAVAHLDTTVRHEIVVRTQTKSRVFIVEPRVSTHGVVGILGDVLILAPAALTGYVLIHGLDLGLTVPPDWSFSTSGPGRVTTQASELINTTLGVLVIAGGLVPLVVDLATNQFYELQPATLEATFE